MDIVGLLHTIQAYFCTKVISVMDIFQLQCNSMCEVRRFQWTLVKWPESLPEESDECHEYDLNKEPP